MKKKKSQNRNWIAIHAHFRTNAGAHGKSKYTRKAKHRNKEG